MSYTSINIQITLIHPVISVGQGSTKVAKHSVYYIVYSYIIIVNSYLCGFVWGLLLLLHLFKIVFSLI